MTCKNLVDCAYKSYDYGTLHKPQICQHMLLLDYDGQNNQNLLKSEKFGLCSKRTKVFAHYKSQVYNLSHLFTKC